MVLKVYDGVGDVRCASEVLPGVKFSKEWKIRSRLLTPEQGALKWTLGGVTRMRRCDARDVRRCAYRTAYFELAPFSLCAVLLLFLLLLQWPLQRRMIVIQQAEQETPLQSLQQ